MGADKALIRIGGSPMVVRAESALRAAGLAEVIVVGGRDVRQLREFGLRVLPDGFPGQGPLGGIITALSISHSSSTKGFATAASSDIATRDSAMRGIITLPCDVVNPAVASVLTVITHLEENSTAAVVVPVVSGRSQWLHAAWRLHCRPVLEAAFAAGVRAPQHAVKALTASGLHVVTFEASEPEWFLDADTPDHLPLRFTWYEQSAPDAQRVHSRMRTAQSGSAEF